MKLNYFSLNIFKTYKILQNQLDKGNIKIK